jgi:hypothetical protein
MRHHIRSDEELPALAMRLVDTGPQIVFEKVVVAHPKAITRHARIHRIRSIGEGIPHIAQGTRGGKQFRAVHRAVQGPGFSRSIAVAENRVEQTAISK